MKKLNVFILLVVVVAVGSGLLLMVATTGNASEVMVPSELLARADAVSEGAITRIRVAGRVAEGEVEYRTSPSISLSFAIHDRESEDSKVLRVVYEGLKPDMFAAGRDVLIDGEYRGGVFYAHQLLTQCPSKYEPADPGAATTGRPN